MKKDSIVFNTILIFVKLLVCLNLIGSFKHYGNHIPQVHLNIFLALGILVNKLLLFF